MPTPKIFVTATNTDVGKTHTVLRLMEEAARRGLKPLAFKPIETGVGPKGPMDGQKLLAAAKRLNPHARNLTIDSIVPYRFELPAAPFVARGDTPIDFVFLTKRTNELADLCDVLFIEGAGGLMVPIDDTHFMIDLPHLFNAQTLLIAPGGLGSINDTLLSLEALKHRHIEAILALNIKEEEKEVFKQITRPYYDACRLEYKRVSDQIDQILACWIGNF